MLKIPTTLLLYIEDDISLIDCSTECKVHHVHCSFNRDDHLHFIWSTMMTTFIVCSIWLTTYVFNNAIQTTAQMAVDTEAVGLSRVHMYESIKCILPLSILFLNILILLECTQFNSVCMHVCEFMGMCLCVFMRSGLISISFTQTWDGRMVSSNVQFPSCCRRWSG